MSTMNVRAARSPASRLFRSRAGQIVIPAMLMFPTLFLFVYLIYETAKLSREKIRHQFAMDSAAFVEMTNYSDFLNRTAYVNGAFPDRIFTEGYGDFPAECEGKTNNCASNGTKEYADILYENGAYPRSVGGVTAFTNQPSWDIEYSSPRQDQLSGNNLTEPFELFTLQNANDYWHPWDLATEIYKLFVQIYSLLGSVEDAQFSVLKRLSATHSFMVKSYWLNTGDSLNDANALAKTFDNSPMGGFNSAVTPVCQRTLDYWGNRHIGGSGIQPYTPAHTDPVVQLQTSAGCSQGLFQVMLVNQNIIKAMSTGTGGYPGISLFMNWSIPNKNYWNVDFAGIMSSKYSQGSLHTTISVMGDPSNKPAVWPDPTPKFQVRQFP